MKFPRRPITLSGPLLASLATVLTLQLGNAQVVINETDADTTGSDDMEFVELFDGGAGNTALDGMVLVFYNGSTGTTRGSYSVIDLDGLLTDGDGFFLAANPMVAGIGDRVTANTGIVFQPSSPGLQNGEDAVALYSGLDAADFEFSDTPYTVPADITLGGVIVLLDAVVYQTSSSFNGSNDSDSGYLGELGIVGDVLDENQNLAPDGEPEIRSKDTVSLGRIPDGQNPLDQSEGIWGPLDPPTPGFPNQPRFELELILSPSSVMENAGAGALEVTVIRDDDGSGALVVSFTGNDPTELDFPAEVTIPDGSFELVFLVDVLDDGAADGTQTVTITASAPDFYEAEASVDVTDDGDAMTLVINEIYAEVEPGQDPNVDGVTDFVGDEFVEIVNTSGAILDISLWELSDREGVRHIFPLGSILGSDCAVVVFGGGGFTAGVRADFGDALVQKASSGGLGLNDSGDSILIRQTGIERAGASFDDYDAFNGDLTRKPELTGPFVSHLLSENSAVFSPGLRGDTGGEFCVIPGQLSLTGVSTFAEDGGTNVTQFTLMRSGSTAAPLVVQLATSDDSEARFQLASAEILAGSDSVLVSVDAVDDLYVDGNQSLELAAHATGFVSAFAEIIVGDDGGDTDYILINEIDVDTPGNDTAEFIELYDGGVGGTSLDGYAVVLLNGANDLVYDVYDLDGRSTNADGFFVIGAPGVPNVDMTDLPGSTGFLQNGSPDAVALYVGNAADFFVGSAVSGSPIDAVVYGGTGEEGDTLGPALGLGTDRVGTDRADDTISRLPDGGMRQDLDGFGTGIPTPGASNQSEGGLSPYDIWASGFPGLGSQLDDVDIDGLTTIVEYALGKNPLIPDIDDNPEGGISAGQLQLTVTKGSDAGMDSNLSYTVEASTDLEVWSTMDTNISADTSSTLRVEYTGAASRAYLRLRVELR